MNTNTKAPLDMSFETTLEELRAKMANLAVDNHWLQLENARLRSELARLAHENSDQCDHIFELQQMVNRAHT